MHYKNKDIKQPQNDQKKARSCKIPQIDAEQPQTATEKN